MQIPYNREASSDGTDPEISSPSLQASHNPENRHPNCLRSQSVTLRYNRPVKLTNPVQDLFHRVRSMNFDRNVGKVGGLSSPASRSDAEVSSDECDGTSRRSTSLESLSSCSSRGVIDAAVIPLIRTQGVSTLPPSKEDLQSSPPSVLVRSFLLPT